MLNHIVILFQLVLIHSVRLSNLFLFWKIHCNLLTIFACNSNNSVCPSLLWSASSSCFRWSLILLVQRSSVLLALCPASLLFRCNYFHNICFLFVVKSINLSFYLRVLFQAYSYNMLISGQTLLHSSFYCCNIAWASRASRRLAAIRTMSSSKRRWLKYSSVILIPILLHSNFL